MNLKPWREIAVPHEDVLKGEIVQAEFAADISRVHDGSSKAEYQNPVLFFQRTFITEGMRLLLNSVVKRLAGQGGDPVIQLQTAFGGGKTHTMLAVYHLAKAQVPASDMQGISAILNEAGIVELPRANIAVLDGIKLAPNQPTNRNGITIHTLWGELAWQLGGSEGYALVKEADLSGTSPGKETLATLLSYYSPCVILIDELVAYIRQFEEGKNLTGGTFDSNLTFVQALTEALKAVPNAILLASLPESEKEAGSQRGVKALDALSHYFGRVQALWKPVSSEEAFEIVRRRLFASIDDKLAAEVVCHQFADFYIANSNDFPIETQNSQYFQRLLRAYPIHPEVFDRLYEDWSTLDNFQRTRGVLKLMAKVIYRLWKDGNNDPLIMPGSLPLYDSDTRNDVIYNLPAGWDPVLERDIDGERAETTDIESKDTRFGSVQACRRTARTIFLGSAPTTANQIVRGVELERILLGAVQAGQQTGIFKDALRRLADKLHYLNSSQNRFWFDTRPNLRREMEERKRRFYDKEDVFPTIQEYLRKTIASSIFGHVHIFTESNDIPDDWNLRLVVLSPEAAFSRSEQRLARDKATLILKMRGDTPRQKQNRLIFLAADSDNVSRLKDLVRSMLAWQSIVSDYKENKLVLDNLMARNAEASLNQAKDALQRMIRETYKWLLAPVQDVRSSKGLSDIQWEHAAINPSSIGLAQEIDKILIDNEWLIALWSPIHLSTMLKSWFWKNDIHDVNAMEVWQKTCQYLYLPRLKNSHTFEATIIAGAESRDFFGLAQGKEGSQYKGFSFGKRAPVFLDSSFILIEPSVAQAYEASLVKPEPKAESSESMMRVTESKAIDYVIKPPVIKEAPKKTFYGQVDIDPVLAKKQFADLIDEVIVNFSSSSSIKVKLTIDIQAESITDEGFDESLQRAIKENCRVLKFKNAEFEE